MKKTLLVAMLLSALLLCSCQNKNLIEKDRAKEIALEHAKLTESQVNFINAKSDIDDGRQVYEVEFYTDDFVEYDYEIDAVTGDIISFDSDAEGFAPNTDTAAKQSQPDNAAVTEESIKATLLEKVPGATEDNIREFNKEFDDGREVYEGKIIFENIEYEFEVNAETGDIISWESESVFD